MHYLKKNQSQWDASMRRLCEMDNGVGFFKQWKNLHIPINSVFILYPPIHEAFSLHYFSYKFQANFFFSFDLKLSCRFGPSF